MELAEQDALILRCTCGSWRMRRQECGACGRMSLIERHEIRRLALIEDVEWMLDTGENHIENIARRCARSPRTLDRLLTKYRPDLLRRMTGRYRANVNGHRRAA